MRQRRASWHTSKWAFAELHGLLASKAALAGLVCIKVDAEARHQTCPRCGWTGKENRPRQGLLFLCQQGHYTLHAGLVGARNVALRTLVIRHDWMRTGKPVRRPSRDQTAKPKLHASGRYAAGAVESGHKPPAFALRVI